MYVANTDLRKRELFLEPALERLHLRRVRRVRHPEGREAHVRHASLLQARLHPLAAARQHHLVLGACTGSETSVLGRAF